MYKLTENVIVEKQPPKIFPAQNFRKHFTISSKEAIRWFPGHMGKGLKQMQQKLKTVDCIIEVSLNSQTSLRHHLIL